MSGFKPTAAQHQMAHSLQNLCKALMTGQIAGVAVAACMADGEPSVFYLNSPDVPVLREPMDRLKVMYESNQDFADKVKELGGVIKNNTSYGIH